MAIGAEAPEWGAGATLHCARGLLLKIGANPQNPISTQAKAALKHLARLSRVLLIADCFAVGAA